MRVVVLGFVALLALSACHGEAKSGSSQVEKNSSASALCDRRDYTGGPVYIDQDCYRKHGGR